MASHGSRFKRLSVDAVTANCVKSPCTQENTLRTFIQRRIMHKLERQEETAQKMSCTCMYLYSFYFNFSVEKGLKTAETPALATDIMKNPSAPNVL
jgi:hypothetical protein